VQSNQQVLLIRSFRALNITSLKPVYTHVDHTGIRLNGAIQTAARIVRRKKDA
jgi:hypothetical protein